MLTVLYAILAALLPAAILIYYICSKDRDFPEPAKWLWKASLYGVASAILAIIIGLICSDFFDVFPSLKETVIGAVGKALFDAAIPEEASKLLLLWLLIRKNPYFDEYLDGIVYATCVGLGFAGMENIIYLLMNLDSLVSVAVLRGLFSVPGHFFFAVVMGYYLSLAHFGRYSKIKKTKLWVLAFLIPVILHCVYDALLMSQEAIPEIIGFLSILFIVFCIWLRKLGIKKIAELKTRDFAETIAKN